MMKCPTCESDNVTGEMIELGWDSCMCNECGEYWQSAWDESYPFDDTGGMR